MTETPSRRRTETQDRLVAAAMVLFAERGIGASTVEQICERAGYTRGAFYSNFESKDELLCHLLARRHEMYTQGLAEASAAVLEHMQRHGSDPWVPADELLARAVRLGLGAYRAAAPELTWRTAGLLSLELSLYAVREPSIRQAYLEHQAALLEPLGPVVEALLAHCGRRLSVTTQEATASLMALFQTAARRALTSADRDVVDTIAPRCITALRCMSEPANS